MAQELHDGIIQVLVSAKYFLETAQLQQGNNAGHLQATAEPSSQLPGPTVTPLNKGLDRLSQALTEVRRISHGLRPALLDDFGLSPAIQLLAEETSEQGPPRIVFETNGAPFAVPLAQSTALFRISQESLTNTRLHAQATEVRITLSFRKRQIRLAISDNGKGFNVERVQTAKRGGIGLRNMRERMEGLGGQLTIRSSPRGTCVTASLSTPAPAMTLSAQAYGSKTGDVHA